MPELVSSKPPSAATQGNTALAVHNAYELQLALERPAQAQPIDETLTITDILRIAAKHKWTLLAVVLAACSLAALRTFLSTPVYRSTAVLQIERAAPRVINFNNEADQDQAWSDETLSLQTQYQLLQSRSLAERVITQLHLDQAQGPAVPMPEPATAAQAAAGAESAGFAQRILSGYRRLFHPANTDKQILGHEAVVNAVLGSETVEPVRNSRLVKVHVKNTDPQLAARMANAIAEAYIAMGLERRTDASGYAKNYLEDQIKQVKAKLEESERKLNQYAQDKQILTLDEKTSVINQTYTDYAAALAKAEQERIKVEALYAEIMRNPDNVPVVIDNKSVQAFKEQKAKLQVEYQQNLRIYKPEFPKMLQIKAQITEMDSQIKAEVATIAAGIQSQYEAAKRQEALLREKLSQTRMDVLHTQDNSIDLNLLKREVDTNRQLYDGLLQRIKQVDVSAGAVANNVSVVDAARAPLFPFEPNLLKNLIVGGGVGLLLGMCLVAVLELMDDSIKFPDEVERLLGVPLLGIIPKLSRKRASGEVALEVSADPRSTIAEAYRSVRTALQFSTSEGAPRRLVITSTTRNEGKSTSSAALAINFAQMGQRVLLIDADMRNPSVHKIFGMPNEHGLSNLLSSDANSERLIVPTAIKNLSLLTAGPTPPNPVDLLMGPRLSVLLNMTSALNIDYVIVDAPPVLGLADAIVLGNQVQHVLFAVQAGRTRKADIKNALRRLRQAGLIPRGAILTQTTRGMVADDYETYYGYGAGEPADPRVALDAAG